MTSFAGLIACLPPGSLNNNKNNNNNLLKPPSSSESGTNNRTTFPVPLKDVAIYAEIRGFAMAITASLTYENSFDEAIECQLVIPVDEPSGMAVYRLDADFDGQRIRGECRSRETAIEIYSTAFDNSYNGILLESQASPDAVRVWLGHLKPRGVVVITLGIVALLGREPTGGIYSVTVPSILNPRYVPDFDEDILLNNGENLFDLKTRLNFDPDCTYISVTGCAYSIGFEAKINLGISNRIAGVTASTSTDELTVRYTEDNRFAIVTLAGPFSADHDLQLLVTPAETNKPIVFFEPGMPLKGDGLPVSTSSSKWLTYHAASVMFEPQGHDDYQVCPNDNNNHRGNGCCSASASSKLLENNTSGGKSSNNSNLKRCRDKYWFVVDRSDSMDGPRLDDAKTALIVFVKSLPLGCKFNVIGFGSSYSPLFPTRPVAYSEKSVAAAIRYAAQLRGDMGGTDLLEPLKFIYKRRKKPAKKKSRHFFHRYQKNEFIFLLTDGEAGNMHEVLALAAQHASTSRFFTVGIGEAASNKALVDGLARVTSGISSYVRERNEKIVDRVVSMLKIARNPTAANVNLEWSFPNHRISRFMPDRVTTRAYEGCPIVQFALVENQPGNTVDGSSTVTADIFGEPFSLQTNFVSPSTALSPPDDTMPVHRLAAKSRLSELTNLALCSGLVIESLRKEAVAISIATGITCDFTAFVAVDADTGTPLKRNCPIFAIPESKVAYYVDDDGVAYHFGNENTPGENNNNTAQRVKDAFEALTCKCNANSIEDDFYTVGDKGTMELLAITQELNGSWKLTLKFTKFFGAKTVPNSVNELRQQCLDSFARVRPPIAFSGMSDEFIATSLGVAILRHKYSTRRREFELIDQKATCFLFTSSSSSISASNNQTNNKGGTTDCNNNNTANFTPSQLTQFINIAVATFQL